MEWRAGKCSALRCLLCCSLMTAMRLSLVLAASAWGGADAAGQAAKREPSAVSKRLRQGKVKFGALVHAGCCVALLTAPSGPALPSQLTSFDGFARTSLERMQQPVSMFSVTQSVETL